MDVVRKIISNARKNKSSSSKAGAEIEVKSSELVINSPPLSLNPPTKNTQGQIPPPLKLPKQNSLRKEKF
jgi:hypothetical protein